MRVFDDTVYDTRIPAASHWEATVKVAEHPPLDRAVEADVAIIGGGYTGLSVAFHLARDHAIAATVLEAGRIGWGASGRNGGFVSLAATKISIATMDLRYGTAATDRFHRSQMEGVEFTKRLIADEGMAVEPQGDAAFDVAHHPSAVPDLKDYADVARRRFGYDARFLEAEAFREIGHGGTEQFGAVRIGGPIAINPLRFVDALAAAAIRHGATVHAETPVIEWSRVGGRHLLRTPAGAIAARTIVLATNGYTPDGLDPAFDNRALPALSNILVTRPLTPDELAAAEWHTECPIANTRELLFYYRLLPDRRFLFGARGGVVGSAAENARMRAWLTRRLGEVFPPWREVEVERFWNGLVCLTGRLTPAVDRLESDSSVLYAFGYHGSGVNTAPWVGARVADAIAKGGVARPDVPEPMRGLPPSLLHPLVRRFGLRAAYAWYGLSDRMKERKTRT